MAYVRRQVAHGHRAVLMGHSFFQPFSDRLPSDAEKAGYKDHSQVTFFEGGSGGSPLYLWNNVEQSPNIKAALDAGGITLLGMTYYPLQEEGVPAGDNLQGYRNWIDYALRENSNFSVFIGMPWARNPDSVTAREWYQQWKPFHKEVHGFIDTLRSEYPQLDIYCLPYGLAVMELNKQFEAGSVPDVVGEVGGWNDYLHIDSLGHAGAIVVDLGRLVWLRGIYGVDLGSFDHGYNYQTDLVKIANWAMNRHDHHYDAE